MKTWRARIPFLIISLVASVAPGASAADVWVGVSDAGFDVWSNVPTGATVRFQWANGNQNPHTVTSYAGQAFDSELRMSGSYDVVFEGTPTRFRCEVHSTLDEQGACDGMCGYVDDDRVAPSPPVVTSPLPGQVLDSTRVLLAGTADDDARWIRYRVDGGDDAWISVDEGRWSRLESFSKGDHLIEVRAFDLANNQSGSVTVAFTIVDDVPPGIPEFLEPNDGAYVPTPYAATVAVDADTASVEFTWADGFARTDAADGVTTAQIFASSGPHTLTVVAVDDLGNRSEPVSIDVTVDARAPVARITQPEIVGVSLGPPLITGTATDDNTVAAVTVRVFDRLEVKIDEFLADCSGCGTPAATWELLAPLERGVYMISAIATDAAGHEAETNTVHLVVI